MSAQGNQHLVKVIEQASEWRMLISQYEVKIKQAENQHDTKIAVEYYTKLAEVWQQVAQQETNLDTKNFYEQKALDYYKKAQPTSMSSIALAKSSSQPVPPMSFGYYCMQLFKSVPQSEERRPLLEQAIVTYTHSPS
ncbi:MAG: hypothetical protein K0S11_1837, partial [Gammaproteobacteria bacterium]|nr:hypothetical protein [Gammaproteobacteria bacterium]